MNDSNSKMIYEQNHNNSMIGEGLSDILPQCKAEVIEQNSAQFESMLNNSNIDHNNNDFMSDYELQELKVLEQAISVDNKCNISVDSIKFKNLIEDNDLKQIADYANTIAEIQKENLSLKEQKLKVDEQIKNIENYLKQSTIERNNKERHNIVKRS